MEKKDVNQDSHIASSAISQSYFFKEVRYLILASSQRKLHGHNENQSDQNCDLQSIRKLTTRMKTCCGTQLMIPSMIVQFFQVQVFHICSKFAINEKTQLHDCSAIIQGLSSLGMEFRMMNSYLKRGAGIEAMQSIRALQTPLQDST